jgi:hypothetical protein
MPLATCPQCGVTATIRRSGSGGRDRAVSPDLQGMAQKCVVLERERAEKGQVTIDSEAPKCPHLEQAIQNALSHIRGRR